ncbi:MAG: hypothetical protein U0Q18_02180 [Bryobacteraceae bacterium]
MSSVAPSASLRQLLGQLEELVETETAERVSQGVRAAERRLAEHLNQAVRRLRQSSDFGEAATVLCDASAPFCNVCAVFRVQQNRAEAVRLRGGDAEIASRFRGLEVSVSSAAAFQTVIESCEPVVAVCSPAEVSPQVVELFGHSPDQKAFLYPLFAGTIAVGILYALGVSEGAALELLAHSAMPAPPAEKLVVTEPVPELVRIEPLSVPAPPKRNSGDWESLNAADRDLHRVAQRFARVQVAEMRLYHADAVKTGRAEGTLYNALQESIDQSRETFRRKFVDPTPTMKDYLHEELVRTLANDNPALLGENYPGPLR